MAKLFLSVRVPEESYSVVTLENIDLGQSVCYLKEQVARKIDFPKDQIELIYCGNVMDDNENIRELDIRPCTLIHVFKKTTQPQPFVHNKTYTDEDCQRIADLFGTVTGTQINVNTRIRILQKIISEFPEFRKNLGAQALIRDSILFHTLNKVEVIRKVAQNYPIICDAAEFIVKTTKKEIAKNERITTGGDETFSDQTSSSEEENASNPSQAEQARIRRISRDQLAAALMMAGTASLNSLSNIAQRNANLAEEQQQQRQQQPQPTQQNPSSSSSSSSSSATTTSTPGRITSSIFTNALSQALLTANTGSRSDSDQVQSMDTFDPQQDIISTPPPSGDALNNQSTRFSSELQIMREMGLSDDNINLQALILSNGDIQAAVNLVLGGMNNLFS